MPRFRQGFGTSPPNVPFERNINTMQSAGLVAWWPPDRHPGIGYGVPDMAGNLPAVLTSGLGWKYDSVFGWAWDYVANEAYYLNAGNSELLNPTGAMSISCWFNTDAPSNEGALVARDHDHDRSYILVLASAKLSFYCGGGVGLYGAVGPNLATGRSYLGTIAGDPTRNWNLYLDGVLIGSMAWSAPKISDHNTSIGRREYPSSQIAFDGRIGDVRIYNRCLSAQEVWQLYDPITRWELYKPLRRLWVAGLGGVVVSPPDPPSGLSATAIDSGQIDLAWTDESADETGFKINRSTDGVNFTYLDTAAADAEAYSDTTCAADTRYWYEICATNAGGDSAYIGPESAKTAPDSASKAQKFLIITGGQVEQSDGRYLALVDGVPEPDTVAGVGWLYIDQADGDLKMKFGDGTVKVISADT